MMTRPAALMNGKTVFKGSVGASAGPEEMEPLVVTTALSY
jgi:hypothetical protein